jgi:hypothetical protein
MARKSLREKYSPEQQELISEAERVKAIRQLRLTKLERTIAERRAQAIADESRELRDEIKALESKKRKLEAGMEADRNQLQVDLADPEAARARIRDAVARGLDPKSPSSPNINNLSSPASKVDDRDEEPLDAGETRGEKRPRRDESSPREEGSPQHAEASTASKPRLIPVGGPPRAPLSAELRAQYPYAIASAEDVLNQQWVNPEVNSSSARGVGSSRDSGEDQPPP